MKITDARATLYSLDSTPLFWQHMDDSVIPHLQLVHKYPDLWPRMRVDRGAIRFVLSGAALMTPGLTSPGGRLPSGKYTAPEEEAGELALGGVRGVPPGEGKEHERRLEILGSARAPCRDCCDSRGRGQRCCLSDWDTQDEYSGNEREEEGHLHGCGTLPWRWTMENETRLTI